MKTHRMSLLAACVIGLAALPALANEKSHQDKFRMMDTDGDGRISKAEHDESARQMFAECDTNADGKVTDQELQNPAATARSAGSQASVDKPGHKLDKFDQNNDGQVTTAEHQMGATAKFNKMDSNQDGFLTQEEMSAGRKEKDHQR